MGVDFYSYYGLYGTCIIGVRLDLRYKKCIGLLYFTVNTITVLNKNSINIINLLHCFLSLFLFCKCV